MIQYKYKEKERIEKMKTEQFNNEQLFQIKIGLEANVDVSIYAKLKFTRKQMYEIREGLEQGLDVSVYANSEYSWKKMKHIREEMMKERENKENEKNL